MNHSAWWARWQKKILAPWRWVLARPRWQQVVLVLVVLFLLNSCSKQAGGPTVPMVPVLPDIR